MNKILGKAKLIVPVLYILGALPIWFEFSQANPDGLANLGLILYTLPGVVVGSFVLRLEFPYFPGGYYEAHALYFLFSVVFFAVILFSIFHGLQRINYGKRSLL